MSPSARYCSTVRATYFAALRAECAVPPLPIDTFLLHSSFRDAPGVLGDPLIHSSRLLVSRNSSFQLDISGLSRRRSSGSGGLVTGAALTVHSPAFFLCEKTFFPFPLSCCWCPETVGVSLFSFLWNGSHRCVSVFFGLDPTAAPSPAQ